MVDTTCMHWSGAKAHWFDFLKWANAAFLPCRLRVIKIVYAYYDIAQISRKCFRRQKFSSPLKKTWRPTLLISDKNGRGEGGGIHDKRNFVIYLEGAETAALEDFGSTLRESAGSKFDTKWREYQRRTGDEAVKFLKPSLQLWKCATWFCNKAGYIIYWITYVDDSDQ